MGDLTNVASWTAKPQSGERPRVVVLGGGFGGVYVARNLERLRTKDEFEILLVNKSTRRPLRLPADAARGHLRDDRPLDVVSPLRRLLPRTDIHVRQVEAIDLENQTITMSTGFHPHAHVVRWDHLVLGVGTVTDFRGMRGLPEHAFPFKSLGDALNLRNHVIRTLEEAAIEIDDPDLAASSSRSSLQAEGSRGRGSGGAQ